MAKSATAAVMRTEFTLFTRELGAIFWIIAFPALLIGVLGFIPGFREYDENLGTSVISLYVPIGILLAMLMSAVSAMPVVIATYREHKVLRRLATTPARPRDLLLAQFVLYGCAAVVGGFLAALVGWLVWGADLPANLFGFVLVVLLMLAASLSIGAVIAAIAPTGKVATTAGTVLIFPLMFTAGVWLPVSVMPGLLGQIVALTPLGAGALALDAAAAGGWPDLKDLIVVAVWTLGLSAFAVRFFRWE